MNDRKHAAMASGSSAAAALLTTTAWLFGGRSGAGGWVWGWGPDGGDPVQVARQQAQWLPPAPVPLHPRHRRRAMRYMDSWWCTAQMVRIESWRRLFREPRVARAM